MASARRPSRTASSGAAASQAGERVREPGTLLGEVVGRCLETLPRLAVPLQADQVHRRAERRVGARGIEVGDAGVLVQRFLGA